MQDSGVLFSELIQQRDDALDNLTLREIEVRYWKKKYEDFKEEVARLNASLFELTRRP